MFFLLGQMSNMCVKKGLTLMLPIFSDYFTLHINIHLENVTIRLTKHLSQNILAIRVEFIVLKFA